MKNKFLSIIVLTLLIGGCSSNSIKSIYHTQAEWNARYKVPEYHENEEIIGEYDKSLAAKCKNGTFVGTLNKDLNVKSWKGVPFAKIPNRFERSVAPGDSDKVYQAFYFGKSAMQAWSESEKASQYPQSDIDCLSLCVYTSNNNKTNKPVLVYIHGGGWVNGGSSDPIYEGSLFSYYNPDVIVVDIQYRLNFMGMINLGIKDEYGEYIFSDYGEKFKNSTNNGLLDQVQALKWIKKNISSFGGDSNNITICGESAGCGSVFCLLTMESDPNCHYLEKEDNLFQKVIAMSGGINQGTTLKASEALTYAFLEDHPNVHTIKDIQDLPFEDLYEWRCKNSLYINYYILDGEVIPLDMFNSFNNYVDPDITLLTGSTSNEFAYYKLVMKPVIDSNPKYSFDNMCRSMFELVCGMGEGEYDFTPIEEFIEAANDYIKALNDSGFTDDNEKMKQFANDYSLQGFNYYLGLKDIARNGNVYAYTFDIPYDGSCRDLGAAHAVDCYYTFGNFDGNNGEGTNAQVEMSRKWQEIISNFCKNGNPSTSDLDWKKYSENYTCAYIGADKFEIRANWNKDRYDAFTRMVDSNEKLKYVAPWTSILGHIDHFK